MPHTERKGGGDAVAAYLAVNGDAANLGYVLAWTDATDAPVHVELRGAARAAASAQLAQRLRACGSDVRHAVDEVRALADAAVASGSLDGAGPRTQSAGSAAHMLAVGRALQELGWHRVADASQDLATARVTFHDASRRVHYVDVGFPPEFPDAVPLLRTDSDPRTHGT